MLVVNVVAQEAEQNGKAKPDAKSVAAPDKAAKEAKSPKDKNVDAEKKQSAKKKTKKEKKDLPVVAIKGATIHTMASAGVIENGVIVVEGSSILAVGDSDLEIPKSASVVDAKGLIITPGLIDADSKLWLTSSSAASTGTDGSLKMLDGVDGFSEDWHETLRHGVTSVYVQPNSRGTLGGFGVVLSVVPESDGPEVHGKELALQASLGVSATTNKTRRQQFDRTKKVFDGAKDYKKKWDEYNAYLKKKEEEEKKAKDAEKKSDPKAKPASSSPASRMRGMIPPRGRPGVRPTGRPSTGRPMPTRPPVASDEKKEDSKESKSEEKKEDSKSDEKKKEPPKKPEKDPVKDLLIKVLEGEIPVRLEIHDSDDAHYALKLIKEFDKLQLVLEGLTDLGSAEKEVLGLVHPVVLGPWLSSSSGYRGDPDSAETWGAIFSKYEGAVTISSGALRSQGSKWLRNHMAAAIAAGVSPETALAGVTIDAARVCGVADKIGSIEVGKRADLVGFSGSPLNSSSEVQVVWSAGKEAYRHDSKANGSIGTLAKAGEAIDGLPESFSIRSTRCLLPNGKIVERVVEVTDGVIAKVRKPRGDEDGVIDLGDAFVTPGLMSSSATLGLARQIDPATQPDASYVVAADAMASGLSSEGKLVESGLLNVLLTPGDSNPVAGSASLVRIGSDNAVAAPIAAAKLVLSGAGRSTERFPSSLAGQLQFIEQSFEGQLLDTRLYLPEVVAERLAKKRAEHFASIKSANLPTLIVAQSDAEIRGALDMVERTGVKATLVGVNQIRPFMERIIALKVGVLASPISSSTYDWYCEDFVAAADSGIAVAFAGETAEQLRLTASSLVSLGMDPTKAVQALCYGSSGLAKAKGLSAGEPANMVIWTDSPVNLAASPLAVIVDGRVVEGDE